MKDFVHKNAIPVTLWVVGGLITLAGEITYKCINKK